MEKLTVEQYEFLKKLSNELPSHYTLKDVLDRTDLNPYIDSKIDIKDVEFCISGILQYAYECTGQTMEYRGTIKEILYDMVGDDIFNTECEEDTPMVKIKDILSKAQIRELAKFFLGDRQETHLDEVTATSTREVTLGEIVNYIRELDVVYNFDYECTVLKY